MAKKITKKDELLHVNSRPFQLNLSNDTTFIQQLLSSNWQNLEYRLVNPHTGLIYFPHQIFKKARVNFCRRFTSTASLIMDLPPGKFSEEIENGLAVVDGPNNDKIVACAINSFEQKQMLYLFCCEKYKPQFHRLAISGETHAIALGSGVLALSQGKTVTVYTFEKLKQCEKKP